MTNPSTIKLKRVYDKSAKSDGVRLLADRLWPRGIKKTELDYDDWIKALCPPNDLRKAWHQDEISDAQFKRQYIQSLQTAPEAMAAVAQLAEKKPITLLSAVKDLEQSHLPILKQAIINAMK